MTYEKERSQGHNGLDLVTPTEIILGAPVPGPEPEPEPEVVDDVPVIVIDMED